MEYKITTFQLYMTQDHRINSKKNIHPRHKRERRSL